MVLPIPEQPVPGFEVRHPIMAALDLLGRRWILRILWELRNGPMGFRALQTICDQMSPSMLSQRLSLLQSTGLIYHTEDGTYALTGAGQELLQALAPLQDWAKQWAEQLRTQEETENTQADIERSLAMPSAQSSQPTLISIAPRFLVRDMEQALAFYGQLGFTTPYHDEGFAILERDGIALQFNVSAPTHEPPEEGCRVCYIGVTNIEALYQQYLPTGALRSSIHATTWGTKGFWLCDPFRNILIFEENIPEEESDSGQAG